MNSTNLTPFKILNASAGSGKTYALVKEYLLLLLKEDNKNNQFAQIVAMTFTNMAAIEMKERIIQNLDLLSFPSQREEESARYATELAKELLIDQIDVQNRAKRVLKTLLHNYEDFHVLTIDKFNLRLIRSFSRDLDLTSDFEVILNEREVIEQVVDLLFDQQHFLPGPLLNLFPGY
jgi:ATP-dependent exoDNAse (exonuclease V) beta subunit